MVMRREGFYCIAEGCVYNTYIYIQGFLLWWRLHRSFTDSENGGENERLRGGRQPGLEECTIPCEAFHII